MTEEFEKLDAELERKIEDAKQRQDAAGMNKCGEYHRQQGKVEAWLEVRLYLLHHQRGLRLEKR